MRATAVASAAGSVQAVVAGDANQRSSATGCQSYCAAWTELVASSFDPSLKQLFAAVLRVRSPTVAEVSGPDAAAP